MVHNGTDDEGINDAAQTPSNTTMLFAHQVIWHWNNCKHHIEHEYSIAAWALCVMGPVWTDVRDR